MKSQGYSKEMTDFDAVRLTIASPERILQWSHGEVLKPETINYRTQKPERDGLFCERIFGPVKDINPNDPKYRGVRNREVARDEKGEIVTRSIVRRERMGHIQLAAPVAHIWFMRGTPSAIGLLLGMTIKNLEKVVYFANYIVTDIDEDKRDAMIIEVENEQEAAKAAIEARYEKLANEDDAEVKELAKQRTEELDETMAEYDLKKEQLEQLLLHALLTETFYRELPREYRDLVTVGMGAKAIKKILDEIDLTETIERLEKEADEVRGKQRKKKLIKRLKVLEGLQRAGIEPSSLVLSVIPVIPPDLRPMVQLSGGRFATSDLNDLYRRVINRNNRLKKLVDLKAPEVIQRNEQRMLQEAVDALIDNNSSRSGRAVSSTGGRRRLKSLSDMLKGKQGRFRQNLLGKRVDYSGRSVIVSGPELELDQCGLPKMMALELFKPFVIGKLIEKDYAHNIKSATRLIDAGTAEVWDALDEVIEGKYVLLNRAPTLHRLGIQAFQPQLIEGKAIQLHPLVCKGFNADFDGDQMAVHLPLSKQSQAEAKELMTARRNLLIPADGSPSLHIEQDIVLGVYYMTYDKPGVAAGGNYGSVDEALFAYDNGQIKLQSPIKVRAKGETRQTTLGRVLYNEIFPEDFPFLNEPTTKKVLLKTMARVFDKYGEDVTAETADKLKNVGFEFATASGLSAALADFTDIEGIEDIMAKGEDKAAKVAEQFEQGLITDEERYRLTVNAWLDVDNEILEAMKDQFEGSDSSMTLAMVSGARGSIGQLKTSVGNLGVTTDAAGNEIELPIKSNYKSGLSPLEYFIGTRSARMGMISTALKTADSGYLTRKLVDVSQDVFTTEDDVADPGLLITKTESEERGLEFENRLAGRVLAKAVKAGDVSAKKGELVRPSKAEELVEAGLEEALIKSVITVESERGIPVQSYGADLASGDLVAANQPVGVIAAQSIGEPGTQLTLDTFHGGGAAGENISQGLPRVTELFEARNPKGEAFISEIDGTVTVREHGDDYIIQVAADEDNVYEHKLGDREALVKGGSKVKTGDTLAAKGDKKKLASKLDGIAEVYDEMIVVIGDTGSVRRYEVPGFKNLAVENGDQVTKGQRLTSGSINPRQLMDLNGVLETQRYIIGEIQRIFSSQGQTIADKHLEVVVRQMFSRVRIDDPGDSTFLIGNTVSRHAALQENKRLAADKKELVQFTQLLLGITKVSTWSDSFLSAASFQDTTRVLIAAALSGKQDDLFGLKENVIIGRKIPVGTGITPLLDDEQTLTEVDEPELI